MRMRATGIVLCLALFIIALAGACNVMPVNTNPETSGPPFTGCAEQMRTTADQALTLVVSYPSDNAELSTSLANVAGTVSSPSTSVTVQGHDAYVDQYGNFIGYALLDKGPNTVVVTASADGKTQTQTLNLSFTHNLAVFLDQPQYGINYNQTPLVATGYVNYPQASVEVNGIPAAVSPDGSFSAAVKVSIGDTLKAVATFGSQADSMSCYLSLAPPPIIGPTLSELFGRSVYLTAGDSLATQVSLDTDKIIRNQSELSHTFEAIEVDGGNFFPAQWPEGVQIYFQPEGVTLYPNTSYTYHLVVHTSAQTPPGEYYFQVKMEVHSAMSETGTIKVIVMPCESTTQSISVNQTVTADGISFTLLHVDFIDDKILVTAFNTPSAYVLPQGPYLAPSEFLRLEPGGFYAFDAESDKFISSSEVSFLPEGMQFTWIIDDQVPKGAKTFNFTISTLLELDGRFDGPWIFTVPVG